MTSPPHPPIRTLTLGLPLDRIGTAELADVLGALMLARDAFVDAGYEVQTLRLASNAAWADPPEQARAAIFERLVAMDTAVHDRGVLLSLGPLLTEDREDEDLAAWGAELNAATSSTHFSIWITRGPATHEGAAATAASLMRRIARPADAGLGNFRFAASAGVPSGTPFFPVAWHDAGPPSLSIGVQTAGLVRDALEGARLGDVTPRTSRCLEDALAVVVQLGRRVADARGWRFGGIDPSPAPLGDASIAAAIEMVTGRAFGEPSTLAACAALTAAVRTLPTEGCGYRGLMLPVLEDAVLARRVAEGRVGLQQLLSYSAVCGIGLDVVPIPGDTPAETVTRILIDVATLATRLGKPLAARLLLIPGAASGDTTAFDNPYLVNSRVLAVD